MVKNISGIKTWNNDNWDDDGLHASEGWAISDAGVHESEYGFYLRVENLPGKKGKKRNFSIALTKSALMKMLDEISERWPNQSE